MRFYALTVLAFSTLVFGQNPDLNDEWEDFVQRFDKNYELGGDEESSRRKIFEDNYDFIQKHNAAAANGEHSYELGINQFADMTTDEINKLMNGFNTSMHNSHGPIDHFENVNSDDLPETINWVNEGYVTEVKDQARCGSCWAFSATGSLEGQHFKKAGKLVSLSEQNLVDCDKVDHGCMGGIMDNAFEFIKKEMGIDTESSYPYTAKNGKKCLFKSSDVGATLDSYQKIPQGDEDALQKAVATVGPISVAIDASRPTFHFYKKGIYYDPECSSVRLDHGVLAAGYGSGKDSNNKAKDYWLVKNSWGKTWGMEGYIEMSRNRKNMCGIATHAVYPVV